MKKIKSEGEDYLFDFFKSQQIKIVHQKEIPNLRGDSKATRIADFYLPEYGLYIEFFGEWAHGETYREEYREKKRVYKNNKIPCVYIYPENFGMFPFLFNRRVITKLKEYNMRNSLRWFRLHLFTKDYAKNLNWSIWYLLCIYISFILELEWRYIIAFILGLFVIRIWIRAYKGYRYIYKRMKFDSDQPK